MKKILKSPGSATIVNAISTGFGAAFGIGLNISLKGKLISSGIKCSSDIGADTNLMHVCIENVLDFYDVETGVEISTKTSLPQASGLSSSSALSNGVTKLVGDLVANEFNLKPLKPYEILNLAIESSLITKVSITGAFDDAAASFFGGIAVTNNIERKIIIKEKMENNKVLIYMPDIMSNTANSDVKKMKLLAPYVELAFDFARKKDYFKALNLNGILYSAALNFDTQIAIDALNAGALASGLSGTGSAFVAVVNDEFKDDVKDIWNSYDGKVIETNVDNQGIQYIDE
ncbi:MAG: shikimate kinase [Methanobrevibacter sp.]|jgi:shikimate kinase|nr:shikimate kinase [Candidatus Methanoflexus mossambicus]